MRKIIHYLLFTTAMFVIFSISGTALALNLDPVDYDPLDFPFAGPLKVEVRTLLLLDMNQELDQFSITDYRKILKKVAEAFIRDYGIDPDFKIENYIMPRKQFMSARYQDLCAVDYAKLDVPKDKKKIEDTYFKNIPKTEYCYYNYDFFKLHLRQIPADVTITNYFLLAPAKASEDEFIVGVGTPVSSSKYLESTLLSAFPYIGRYAFLKDDPRHLIPNEERLDRLAYTVARNLSRTMLHLGEVDSAGCIMSKDINAGYAAYLGENGGAECDIFTRSLNWDITHFNELITARRYADAAAKTDQIRSMEYDDVASDTALDIFAVVLADKLGGKTKPANECANIKNIPDEQKLKLKYPEIEKHIKNARDICKK